MTALTQFRRALRFMLNDRDASAQKYEDSVLDDAVRTAIQTQCLPDYALTAAEDGITPDMDANAFALGLLHSGRLFLLPLAERSSFRTRGFAQSLGGHNRYLTSLEGMIHQLENGNAFSGWQSLYAWFAGMSGLPLGSVLTEFDAPASLWSTSLTADGFAPA